MESMYPQPGASSSMCKPGATRKRVPNFTADEKALLTHYVKKRPIVESKQTDSKSIEKKKIAWDSIAMEFNSNNNVLKRDSLTLKRAWDNMKALTRKARAAERKNGGGLGFPQQGGMINMEEAPPVICEIQNSFDSDGSFQRQIHDNFQPELSQAQADIESNLSRNMIVDGLGTWGQEASRDVSADNIAERDMAASGSTRRSIDYVRREAVMRTKHFESKKEIEMRTLKAMLEVQEIKTRAAKLEEETNKVNLEIAKIKLNDLKRRLEN